MSNLLLSVCALVLSACADSPGICGFADTPCSDYEATTTSLLQMQHELKRKQSVALQTSDFRSQAQRPFSIVMVPDTQHENANTPEVFKNQTRWLREQILRGNNSQNVVLITHIGDVVQTGSDTTQWERAFSALSLLNDLDMPLSILPGDHDFDTEWKFEKGPKYVKASGAENGQQYYNTTEYVSAAWVGDKAKKAFIKMYGFQNYQQYLNPLRYIGAPWFGGADPSGLNTFQYFSGGGFHFLHLALEYAPEVNLPKREPSPFHWAEQVLHSNPKVPTIITTHEYLSGSSDKPGRTDTGQDIWDTLVRQHNQVIMILCGHAHSGLGAQNGQYHQMSVNDFSNPVIEVLSNFQQWQTIAGPHLSSSEPVFRVQAVDGAGPGCIGDCVHVRVPLDLHLEGGANGVGLLRLITFDLSVGRVHFQTYSPWLNGFVSEGVEEAGQRATDFTLQLLPSRLFEISK